MARFWRHKRVGLALGSGGARGWAHLGVLQALREKGIEVDVVAGTSMGAVIGSFFAAGREDVLLELARNLDWKRLRPFFWEVTLSRSGLTDGRKLLEEFRKMLGLREFRELDLPFRAVATDLDTGGEVVLSSGNLLQAVRASISAKWLTTGVAMPSSAMDSTSASRTSVKSMSVIRWLTTPAAGSAMSKAIWLACPGAIRALPALPSGR